MVPEGQVNYSTFCAGIGPYWISEFTESSFTFNFSPPVNKVVLAFDGLENNEFSGIGHEEVAIEINGAPYFIPNAGSPSFCQNYQPIVTAGGNLMAEDCQIPFSCVSACKDLEIFETINSITIRDLIIGDYTQFGVTFSIHFCCGCFLDAGMISAQPIQLCSNVAATVPPATNTMLPSGNLLQYVLFSDANNFLGSILAVSHTPSFSFDPATMQPSTTYYIAAVAGDDLNGNVDLDGDCLDFSNPIEVLWLTQPSVVFAIDNPDVCEGECAIVTAIFTGEPPFTMIYDTSISGSVTGVFQDDTGTFEICIPQYTAPGILLIQAISLTDANCSCN